MPFLKQDEPFRCPTCGGHTREHGFSWPNSLEPRPRRLYVCNDIRCRVHWYYWPDDRFAFPVETYNHLRENMANPCRLLAELIRDEMERHAARPSA